MTADYAPKHGIDDDPGDVVVARKIAMMVANNRVYRVPVGRHRASITDLRVIGRDGNLTNSTRVRRSYPSLAPLTLPVEL